MYYFIQQHSKWIGTRKGVKTILEVVGIWATGTGDNYQPVTYELQEEGKDVVPVSREEMEKMIDNKILIRTY